MNIMVVPITQSTDSHAEEQPQKSTQNDTLQILSFMTCISHNFE